MDGVGSCLPAAAVRCDGCPSSFHPSHNNNTAATTTRGSRRRRRAQAGDEGQQDDEEDDETEEEEEEQDEEEEEEQDDGAGGIGGGGLLYCASCSASLRLITAVQNNRLDSIIRWEGAVPPPGLPACLPA